MGKAVGGVILANPARILVDEDLSPRFIRLLRQLKYDVDRVPRRSKDVNIIRSLGATHGSRGVWITADRAAMTEHRDLIRSSGISIAFLNVHNALRDTQCFLIFSFIYRRGGLTQASNAPLYFKMNIRPSPLGPNITIRTFAL